VDINVREYNSRVVYVLGAVRVPGRYALGQKPLTVRDIVIQAGLPTVQAANWRAFVVRQTEDGPVYLHVNLNKLLYRGRMENNVQLQTGDTVYVPMTFLDSFASFLGRIFGPIFGISRTVVGPAAAF
ncbi:MAG: hypothetical protein LHV69_11565, partial [Elusimicrobia bacterium]|nr:hypothetical protein [Candidatus Obscuribacterium magneticum]